MTKKLISIMAVCACVFGLTACGGTEVNTVEGTTISDIATESYMISYGESVVSTIDAYVREGYTSSDTDDEAFGEALDDYAGSVDDIGAIEGYDNEQVVIDEDGNYEINIGVIGSGHSADIVITIDPEEGVLESWSTNVRYSSGELLSQAGLNTLLGMGTTFVVLIILMLLIYSFRLIGIFQEKQKQKAAMQKEAQEEIPAEAAVPEVTGEYADDQELIAVIAAAIAANEEETGAGTGGFVVRSIRKSRRKQGY